jgi:crossover junction endodeoxyribonuclease RusA
MIEFYTAYPPSVNNYYVKTRNGVHISAAGKRFRKAVIQDVKEQLAGLDIIDHKVTVDLIFWIPDKRRRDIDNLVKPIFDAITHADLWTDDCQVDQFTAYRGELVKGGASYVRIREAGPRIPPMRADYIE